MDEISKAIQGARAAQRGRIMGSFSNFQEVTADDDAIRKGEEVSEENPFDKAAEEADVEKSDVMDALSYQGDIKVSKTGKEIKDQVDTVLLPAMTADLSVKEAEADKKLKDCGTKTQTSGGRTVSRWTAVTKSMIGKKPMFLTMTEER